MSPFFDAMISGEGEELVKRGEAAWQGANHRGEGRLTRVSWHGAAGRLHAPIVAERWA